MASLRNQISNYVTVYVALPMGLLLLLLNVLVWKTITERNEDRVNHLAEDGVQAVSTEVESTLEGYDALAKAPMVAALLDLKGKSNRTAAPDKDWDAEKWFEEIVNQAPAYNVDPAVNLTAGNLNVQSGPVAKAMRDLAENNNAVGRILVTDLLGEVRASNFKLLSLNFGSDSWWRSALSLQGSYHFEGMDDDGRFWASKAIIVPGQEAPIGVIRAEVLMEGLVASLEHTLPYENGGLAIRGYGEEFYFTYGNPQINEQYADPTVRRVVVRKKESGWRKGVRFTQLLLDEKYDMANRPRVLAFIEEPMTPPDQVTKIGICLLASIAFHLFMMVRSRRAGDRLGEGTTEILAAGNLLLHRMKDEAGGTPAPQSIKGHEFKKVEDQFSQWLKRFRQSTIDNIETHQFETERDQELAREFQMAYLNRPYPSVPARTSPGRLKLTFHNQYKPAMALGGDFFEIAPLAPDVAGVFISDVMGHGTRSALITSSLRSLINDNRSQGRNARLFMSEVNKGFCELLSGVKMKHPMFASAYYFVADVTARAATFSTAGHPAPIHINRAGNHVTRLVVSEPHGAALGIDPHEEYTGGSCRLAAGDVFILYTDGLYEAFNAYGQEFGMDKLEKTLRGLMHNSMTEMVDGLLKAVEDFTENEPLQDDICILGIEVSEG